MLEKPINFIKNNYHAIIIAIIIIITGVMIFKKCHQQLKNPVADGILIPQPTIHSKLSDSLVYASQVVLLAETQKRVISLESALQQALANEMRLTKQMVAVEYTDSIVYLRVPGKRDTVFVSTPSVPQLVNFPMKFIHKNNWLDEHYTVFSADSSSIDDLIITNVGHFVIGEKGKWFQKKTLMVGLLNENPYIKIDNVHSVSYQPKEHLQISFGPVILVNEKSASFGVGANLKKGLFSFNLGYKVF